MNRVVAGSRPASVVAASVGSMLEMNRHSRPSCAVRRERLVGHHRPEVGAADADVDHRADALAGDAGPLAAAHLVGEGVDAVAARRGPAATTSTAVDLEVRAVRESRSAVCRTARSSVTLMCRPSNIVVAAAGHPDLVGERQQRGQHVVVDQALRQVDVEVGRVEAQPSDPVGVGVEPARAGRARSRRASAARRDQASVEVGSTGASVTGPPLPARRRLEGRGHGLQQLVPGGDELVDALLDQDLDDVVVVDAGLGERVHVRRGVVVERPDPVAPDLAVVGHGVQGLLRHRVHGVLDDQVDDVHGVVVVGVLDAGRGPQRPLLAGARSLERGPAVAAVELLERLERQPGVGDAGLALQGRVGAGPGGGGVEALVDLGVDAGDEERRDRVDGGQVVAVLAGLLEAGDVGLHDVVVLVEPEDQGHVDADAGGQGLGDRRAALLGAGDLDEQVGLADGLPEVGRLGDRAVGVVGETGGDLDRDPAVDLVGRVEDRPQHLAALADVVGGDGADGLVGVGALRRPARGSAGRSARRC